MKDPIQNEIAKVEFVLPMFGEYFDKIVVNNESVYLEKSISQYDNEDMKEEDRILVTQDYMAFLTSTKRDIWAIDEETLKKIIAKGNALSEEFVNCDSEDSFRDLTEEDEDIKIEITPIADDYELKGLLEAQINHRLYS